MSPRSSSPPHSRRGEQCRRGHLPLLIRGGVSNVAAVIFPSSFEEGRAMSPRSSSPPHSRRGEQCRRGHLPLLIRGGESNVAVVIFPSSLEEGCPRSGRGGRASQVKMHA